MKNISIPLSVIAGGASFLSAVLTAWGSPADKDDPRDIYSTDGWKLTWSEEFDGTGVPSRDVWSPEVGFIRNHEPQYYTDMREENCCQKDGALVITARKEVFPNADYGKQKSGWKYGIKEARYTSADIVSKRTFLYGRIEIRAQLPNGQGAWPALWTLGDCLRKPKDDPDYWNWPCCGEIDLVEIWGNNPCRVAACLHTSDAGWKTKANEHHKVTGGGDRTFKGPGENPGEGFHIYTLDWYEDKLVMFYDGKRYGGATLSRSDWPDGSNPFRKPHFLLMNLALGGWGNKVVDEDWTDPKTGKTVPAAKFPMEMKVDWVRYYTREK